MKNKPRQLILTLAAFGTLLVGPAWAVRSPEPKAGWQALQERRYEDAANEAQAVLANNPDNEDANWLAAEVALALGDTAACLNYWYQVLNENPAQPRAVLSTIEIYIDQNDLVKTQQIMDLALTRAKKPDLPEFLYSQGILLNAKGEDAEAMVRISQAIDKNPKEPLFYVALARVYEKKRVLVLAIENYMKAIELDSTNATYHYNLAKDLMDSKQYTEALNEFKITSSLDPQFPNVYYQIGKLYFYAEKYDEAVRELEAALANAKEPNFYFCTMYGQALREVRRLEDAQGWLEKAYALKPAEVSTARALALNSFDLKKYDRAVEVLKQLIVTPEATANDYAKLGEAFYNRAGKDAQTRPFYDSSAVYLKKGLELNPTSSRLAYIIGMCHYNKDQYDSAAVYYEIVVSLDSTNYQAYNKLGYCYLKLERYKEAIARLRVALTIDSTSVPARMMLAQTLGFVDSTRAAKQEFQKIIQMDPQQGDAYGSLGFIYLREASNLPEDAERETVKAAWSRTADVLRKATELSPNNVAYWIGYGHCVYNLREFDQAENAFRRALKIDPNNKDAKTGLETVEKVKARKRLQ